MRSFFNCEYLPGLVFQFGERRGLQDFERVCYSREDEWMIADIDNDRQEELLWQPEDAEGEGVMPGEMRAGLCCVHLLR